MASVEGTDARWSLREMELVTVLMELGDLTRLDSQRELMSFLELVPSDHSSEGATVKRGLPRRAKDERAEC